MSRRVLVVDDDPLVLDVIASMLADLGCDVVTADGGMDALEKLNIDANIDVLITDINMPGVNGYELVHAVRRHYPGLRVLVCSGYAEPEQGVPLVRKPYTQDKLASVMARTTGLR